MENRKQYWFKRRRYGYGWIPVTWQGWSVVIGYVVIVAGLAPAFLDAPEADQARELGFYLMFVAMATAGLIFISRARGPKPKWRWGARPEDNPEEDF
jgi:hypothetical protein